MNVPTDESLGKLRLAWLRGDSSNEGTLFRERYQGYLLGDIVNNTPVAIQPPQGSPYYMNQRGRDYAAFKEQYKDRTTYVYVGANDGMLHAFDQNGNEKWAFIPAGVTGNLNLLSDPDYSSLNKLTTNSSKHRFFVDGPLITDDVYFDNEWHTVLIGTLGRGGQGLFALDVTNPNSPKLLWEYGAYNKELVEQNALPKKAPGYILAAPVIGPLSKDSKGTAPDYVIFGNGYGSTAEDNTSVYTKGTSIAIEIATGELHSAIGREASDNNEDLGFAGVVGMKSNKTGYNKFGIERNTFYAGNTKGEMYLTVPLTTSATDVTGNKLVTNIPANRVLNNKTTPQSITAAPELFRAKISRQQVDLLFFGTGKYFEQQDSVDVLTARNSIYGLNVNGTNKVDSNSTINDLRARTVKDEEYQSTEMQRTYTVRTLEGENMNWTTNKGFYVDLPEGELVIDQPYSMGKVVFFMVMVMDTKDPCDPKTRYWLMAIDPLTGKTPTFPVFDLNGTGVDNPIISGVLLDSKPIIQGGSNAIAVTNNDRIKLMPYDASRVRTSRMIFQGDNFFKN